MAGPRRFDWLFRPQLAAEDMPLSAETRFAEALAELPAVERSALALSEIGGLDANEIAERLGTDPAIVRKVLVRARESVRTTLAVRSRRGLNLLIPFQNWWQSGSSAPAVRAAGAVAAAVVGTGVAIGGASADGPRDVLTNPDPPAVRTLGAAPDRDVAPAAAALVAATARAEKTAAPAATAAPPAAAAPRSAAPVANASPPHVIAEALDLPAAPKPASPPAAPSAPAPVPTTVAVTANSPAAVPPADVPPVTVPAVAVEPPTLPSVPLSEVRVPLP